MANSFFVPFNNNPSGVDYGNTSRPYTCPAGKYARITATLYAETYGTAYNGGAGGISQMFDSSSNTTSLSFWIDAGDIVSCSTVAANSAGSPGLGVALSVTDTSSATLQVNSQTISELKESVRFSGPGSISGVGSQNWNYDIDGNSDVRFHVEEYDKIS